VKIAQPQSAAGLLSAPTNPNRNYPFHLPIPFKVTAITGVVLVDQAKSIDFKARKAKFIAKAPVDLLEDILAPWDAITK
jgi:mRNA interferase MazF